MHLVKDAGNVKATLLLQCEVYGAGSVDDTQLEDMHFQVQPVKDRYDLERSSFSASIRLAQVGGTVGFLRPECPLSGNVSFLLF